MSKRQARMFGNSGLREDPLAASNLDEYEDTWTYGRKHKLGMKRRLEREFPLHAIGFFLGGGGLDAYSFRSAGAMIGKRGNRLGGRWQEGSCLQNFAVRRRKDFE